MVTNKKLFMLAAILGIASMLFAACGPTPTAVVSPPQIIEKEVTKMVEVQVEVEKVVTATPAVVSFDMAPDPTTLTYAASDDAASLDPHLAYEGSSYEIIKLVSEGLIQFKRESASEFVPLLATELPTVENGGISADGMTYTFKIRPGVKFHNGNDLTASDVAYSFERVLLQSDPNSGAWMMLEAIMGFASGDVTEKISNGDYAGDAAALKANAKPEDIVAACEDVKSHFTADDAAGTFSVTLPQPFGPFLTIIANPWAYVVDQQWATEVGDWDGSCNTWQDFYAPGQEATKLAKVINGTGPYKLDHWTPDVEWVMTANEDYWRKEGDPIWEGGPSGVPKIKRIVHKVVTEWGTKFAMMQTGDAAWVDVPLSNYSQIDAWVGETCDYLTNECKPSATPEQPLRVWINLPNPSRTDIFLNFGVKTGETGNPYIGSGKLDGNGVPPNFFSDIHMRKAFSYCFDYDTYIAEAQNGEGVRNSGVIVTNMLGYNPDQAMYPFDMDKCKEELDLAWDGKLAEAGFRVQGVTGTGLPMEQTALAIMQSNLRTINPLYRLEIVTLPWPAYLAAFRAGILPIAVSGWSEDYHDPHNWVQPFLVGTYANRMNTPEEFRAIFRPLIEQAVRESDPAKRQALYFQIGQLRYENVPEVNLSQVGSRHYEQRWVQDFYYNAAYGTQEYYIYAFNLAGNQ